MKKSGENVRYIKFGGWSVTEGPGPIERNSLRNAMLHLSREGYWFKVGPQGNLICIRPTHEVEDNKGLCDFLVTECRDQIINVIHTQLQNLAHLFMGEDAMIHTLSQEVQKRIGSIFPLRAGGKPGPVRVRSSPGFKVKKGRRVAKKAPVKKPGNPGARSGEWAKKGVPGGHPHKLFMSKFGADSRALAMSVLKCSTYAVLEGDGNGGIKMMGTEELNAVVETLPNPYITMPVGKGLKARTALLGLPPTKEIADMLIGLKDDLAENLNYHAAQNVIEAIFRDKDRALLLATDDGKIVVSTGSSLTKMAEEASQRADDVGRAVVPIAASTEAYRRVVGERLRDKQAQGESAA